MFLLSPADRDGIRGGSAGGRDCRERDGDPAHHPGTDCYFGAGNRAHGRRRGVEEVAFRHQVQGLYSNILRSMNLNVK